MSPPFAQRSSRSPRLPPAPPSASNLSAAPSPAPAAKPQAPSPPDLIRKVGPRCSPSTPRGRPATNTPTALSGTSASPCRPGSSAPGTVAALLPPRLPPRSLPGCHGGRRPRLLVNLEAPPLAAPVYLLDPLPGIAAQLGFTLKGSLSRSTSRSLGPAPQPDRRNHQRLSVRRALRRDPHP